MHHKARKQLLKGLGFKKCGNSYYLEEEKTIKIENQKIFLDEITFDFTGKNEAEIIAEIFKKGVEEGRYIKTRELQKALRI